MPYARGDSVHVVLFENKTTGTVVGKGKKVLDPSSARFASPESVPLSFLQLLDEGRILIGIPPRCCASGHRVVVSLLVSQPGKAPDVTLLVAGVIEDVETGGTDCDAARLQFGSHDRHHWKHIHDVLERRQTQAADLFFRLRGR